MKEFYQRIKAKVRDKIDAADQAIMARLSAESSPVLDRFLPTLSRSADFFVLSIGIAAALERALAVVGPGPAFLTVDVDVLDPAFAPGTGTPEPGGMTTVELLWACRELASRVERFAELPRLLGDYRVTTKIENRVIDLYVADAQPLDGIVMIGDALQSVCPATGTGLSKVLTDVVLPGASGRAIEPAPSDSSGSGQTGGGYGYGYGHGGVGDVVDASAGVHGADRPPPRLN